VVVDLPQLQTPLVMLLGGAGALAMLYGSVQALLQVRLKRVIAYSTVAQLGYLLLVFPLASVAAWQGVVYHALSHGVAKAALFLAAANVMYVLGHDRLGALRGLAQRPLARVAVRVALASVSIMGCRRPAGSSPSGCCCARRWPGGVAVGGAGAAVGAAGGGVPVPRAGAAVRAPGARRLTSPIAALPARCLDAAGAGARGGRAGFAGEPLLELLDGWCAAGGGRPVSRGCTRRCRC
jgi:multicomponent Na+:H+ antiporter subunit D